MKESKYIYRLDVPNKSTILVATRVATIEKVGRRSNSFCYLVYSEDDLNTIIGQVTILFHQDFFKVDQKPVLIFKNQEVLSNFVHRITPLNIGEYIELIDGSNQSGFYFPQKPSDFSTIISSGYNGTKYFIASNDNLLLEWQKKCDSSGTQLMIQQYSAQIEIQLKERELRQLRQDYNLIKESLEMVKIEYSKELNWYKSEIEAIKKWYKSEYEKTPQLVTKFFKKLF